MILRNVKDIPAAVKLLSAANSLPELGRYRRHENSEDRVTPAVARLAFWLPSEEQQASETPVCTSGRGPSAKWLGCMVRKLRRGVRAWQLGMSMASGQLHYLGKLTSLLPHLCSGSGHSACLGTLSPDTEPVEVLGSCTNARSDGTCPRLSRPSAMVLWVSRL